MTNVETMTQMMIKLVKWWSIDWIPEIKGCRGELASDFLVTAEKINNLFKKSKSLTN